MRDKQGKEFVQIGVATTRKASGEETRTPLYIEAHRLHGIRMRTEKGENKPLTARKPVDGENPEAKS